MGILNNLKSVKLGLVLGVVALAGSALAQDWGQYKGGSAKTGRNNQFATSGPGRAYLNWWDPDNLNASTYRIIRDNTEVGTFVAEAGPWSNTVNVAEEAQFTFLPNAGASPSYRFTSTIASAFGSDPTIQQNLADPKATMTFTISTVATPPGNYALYAWIPIGATTILGNQFYPQRYYVYEVLYGNNQRFVDVVDIFQGGTGWVRLGNGGKSTQRIFSYTGTTTLRVVLHNTVPRNEFGVLTSTPGTTLVYGDAVMAVTDFGSYAASPVIHQLSDGVNRTVSAVNRRSVGIRDGAAEVITTGIIRSWQSNTAKLDWEFNVLGESENTLTMENDSAGVTADPGWGLSNSVSGQRGTGALISFTTNNLAAASAVTYAPTLDDGTFEIYVWCPGPQISDPDTGQGMRVEIWEGLNVTVTEVSPKNSGWARVGSRRFTHNNAAGDPLTVKIVNYSAQPIDNGALAVADAVRFVGATNLAVNSTPMQLRARVNVPELGGVAERDVVVTAAEDGRIYCLDAMGRGDGTTNIYWIYPSVSSGQAGWTDPNHVAGEDGPGGVATMPTGFDLSSATMARLPDGEDYLFIATTNGRVYSIAMRGRGDMDLQGRIAGTTTRAWSFPNDYPASTVPSSLGSFTGSLAFSTEGGVPTVYVPTKQGRMYALNAVAGPNKTTSVRWAFPALNTQTLGEINGTPAVEFGKVFFGTNMLNGNPGAFYALDASTGAQQWVFTGDPSWGVSADDFSTGCATGSALDLGGGMPDTVYVANDNFWITALNANTGAVIWTTDEVQSPIAGSLAALTMEVLDTTSSYVAKSVLMCPTTNGTLTALFAGNLGSDINVYNGKLAYQFNTAGGLTASIATGRNWMSAADDAGFLYNFNNNPTPISGGPAPGQQSIPPNSSLNIPFRQVKTAFINKATYQQLRVNPTSLTYVLATNPANFHPLTAFEWGETIYVLVYDFPYLDTNLITGGAVSPELVNFAFSVEGAAIRNLAVEAKRFAGVSPALAGVPGLFRDGFAVLPFTLQGAGSNALPPGNGNVTISISTSALTDPPQQQNVILDPNGSRKRFQIANPIALVMALSGGVPDALRSLGYTTNSSAAEALMNGSSDLAATPAKREDLMFAPLGYVIHGQSADYQMYLVDRSMMAVLRGPGQPALTNVRVTRNDLSWQGGLGAVVKPLPVWMTLFEDYPTQFPNVSLDYPDIRREYIGMVKDKFGTAENPVYSGVSLNAPTNVDENNPLARVMSLTPLDITVQAPRFQPPNNTNAVDSAGATIQGGYTTRLNVYVDGDGNGLLDRGGGRREAFRSLNIGLGVTVDERIEVGTPNVDLGSLPMGAGFSPLAPWQMGSPYSPWTGPYTNLFQPFSVINNGNVNMINLRIAKSTNVGGAYTPWGLFSPANHALGWIDTEYNLWSDIDSKFAITPSVAVQKPRVGDRLGTELSTNPVRRENAFLGVTSGALLTGPGSPTPASPKVGVSIPIGTPSGIYSTLIRVIEDGNLDQSLSESAAGNPLEVFSDPSFVLRFTVRESRLTNTYTPKSAPMVQDLVAGNESFLHQNLQPAGFRDLAGNLVLAYASNAPAFNSAQPTQASTNDAWRLYIATLDGNTIGGSPGASPLRDLNNFANQGARWYRQEVGPYPNTAPDVLFNSQGTESVIAATAKYGAPAFPSTGFVNPFGANTNTIYLAFVGEAQKQTASGRVAESRLMLGEMQVDGAGVVTLGAPAVLGADPQQPKGKPSIVQAGSNATVFYGVAGTGQSQIHYVTYNGSTFGNPQVLNMGPGFESVSGPSVTSRTYQGATFNTGGFTLNAGQPLLEMSFSGKLRGRPHAEIFFGRMACSAAASPQQFIYLPERFRDRLSSEPEAGLYRSEGVVWNASATIELGQVLNNVYTNLEVAGSRTVDRESGIISFNAKLGGRVFLDPASGTVRFSNAIPARNAQILLTHTPRFVRVSGAGTSAPYSGSAIQFDNRLTGEFDYWARPNNTGISPNEIVRTGRFWLTYGRGASGAGQATRPYMQTMRFGIQLPYAVHVQPNGALTQFQVTGATGYYQVDPANGRVYFTGADENRSVQITYRAADEATGQPFTLDPLRFTVGLIKERSEQPVPIEQAVSETQLTTFLDPFDPQSPRRPGLVWMFWTSTRGGTSDIFYQTLAPRFAPFATNR